MKMSHKRLNVKSTFTQADTSKLTQDVTSKLTPDVTSKPFTESGNCDDEITIEFNNKKKLFASKNFLRYASPVFDAMFSYEFKEKKQNSVKMTGKKYEDFLEFLLCIHPRVLKPITEANVLRLVVIAEEYQVTSITSKCKEFMESWLVKTVEQAKLQKHYLYHADPLRQCIRILAKADELNYDDIVTSAVKTAARFGHILYTQKPRMHQTGSFSFGEPTSDTKLNNETLGKIHDDCIKMFSKLPTEIKYRILSERLHYWNDETLK